MYIGRNSYLVSSIHPCQIAPHISTNACIEREAVMSQSYLAWQTSNYICLKTLIVMTTLPIEHVIEYSYDPDTET